MSTRSDEEKAARRGRGFQCVRCLKKGVEYINIKSRVEDHICKTHLAPDQLPYNCTLCLFRCTKKEDLQRHLTHYRGHIARLQDNKGNRMPDSPDFLIENPNPYILGSDSDYIKLSKSDSQVHFLLKSKAEETLPTDIIIQAAKEIINPVPETEETPLIPTTEATTTVKDPAIQPIWQMFLSMLEVNKQKGLPLPPTATIPAGQNSFLPATPAPTAPVSPSVPLAMQVPETVYPGLSMLGASSMPYNVWKQPIVTSVVTASWPIVNQTLPPLTYTMPMTNCLLPATSSRQMEP